MNSCNHYSSIFILFLSFLLLPFFADAQKKSQPRNYGGKVELKRIFLQEVYYPPEHLEQYYKGKVTFDIEVDADGSLLNSSISQSGGKSFDDEAERIFKLLLWEPGIANGEPIRSKGSITFKFNADTYVNNEKFRGYDPRDVDPTISLLVIDESEVDEKPILISKFKDFNDFAIKTLEYPIDALDYGVMGVVEVEFVVEPTGRVTNIRVSKPLEGNCDVASVNLIHLTNWEPATRWGRPVRCLVRKKLTFDPGGNQGRIIHSEESTPNR